MDRPFTYNGYRVIIASPVKTNAKVSRTWKERFFTLPFRPFNKFKLVSRLVDIMEDGQVINSFGTLTMNEKTWDWLKG